MKKGILVIALTLSAGIYSFRCLFAQRGGGGEAASEPGNDPARIESVIEPDSAGLEEALASWEEGFRAAKDARNIGKIEGLLAGSDNRSPFARAAYEYGLRDGYLVSGIDEGARELVSRLIDGRDQWLALFGQEFLHDGINLAVFRDVTDALQALRDAAPPVVQREFLERIRKVFTGPGWSDLQAVVTVMLRHPEARPADLLAAIGEWRAAAPGAAWKQLPGWIRNSLSRALATESWESPGPPMADRHDEWSVMEGRIDSVPPERAGDLMKELAGWPDWKFKFAIPDRLFRKWADANFAEAAAWLEKQPGRSRVIHTLYGELFRSAVASSNRTEAERIANAITVKFGRDAGLTSLLSGKESSTLAAPVLNRSNRDSLYRSLVTDQSKFDVRQLRALLEGGELNTEAQRMARLAIAVRERDFSAMTGQELTGWLQESVGEDAVWLSWPAINDRNPAAAISIMTETDDPRLLSTNFIQLAAYNLYQKAAAAGLDTVIDAAETRPELAPVLLGQFAVEWARDGNSESVVEWFQSQDLNNPWMQQALTHAVTRMVLFRPTAAGELVQLSTDPSIQRTVLGVIQDNPRVRELFENEANQKEIKSE